MIKQLLDVLVFFLLYFILKNIMWSSYALKVKHYRFYSPLIFYVSRNNWIPSMLFLYRHIEIKYFLYNIRKKYKNYHNNVMIRMEAKRWWILIVKNYLIKNYIKKTSFRNYKNITVKFGHTKLRFHCIIKRFFFVQID